jgi:hypothetical protein
MDCAQFEEIVHDIERPGTEGYAQRERALAHAESCAECARLMTELESLDTGLHAMAVAVAGWRAPGSVESALMSEFRRQKLAQARWSVRRQIVALGTAAAAFLALGFSLHHYMAGKNSGSGGVVSALKTPVANVATANSAATGGQDSANVVDADGTEYASFVPLPYADDPSALDDGTVVRVEMPRSALASFGLPVAAMESDGPVRADLIVSADGTPQAIRLVSQDGSSQ